MVKKKVTVIVLGADQKLWTGGSLRLKVTDLREGLKILKNVSFQGTSNIIEVNLDLPFNAGQAYGLQVDAENHRSAWQIIKRRTFLREESGHLIEVGDAIFRLMVVPKKPKALDLNQGYDRLEQEGSPTVNGLEPWPRERYLDMEDAQKMALLNIDAKMRDTRINGLPIRSYVQGVAHVAAARVYWFVRPELKDLVAASSDFSSAPGHKKPKDTFTPLPAHPDSWKHNRFGAGNLQLSFSKSTMPSPSHSTIKVHSVDADIDLERDLLHVVEWFKNELTGHKTDQTLVYALLFSQGVIPRYRLATVDSV